MIRRLTIENLCTIDNADIDLSDKRLIMVVGGSGSGKSTLIGSIFACLYGSYPDKPDISLYSDVMDKDKLARLSLEIEHEGKQYLIERTIDCTENKTYAYVYDATDTSKPIVGPQVKGVASWVNRHIMDRYAFLCMYYLSQKGRHDLCELGPSAATDILLGLFATENYANSSSHFLNIAKNTSKVISGLQSQFGEIRESSILLKKKEAAKRQLEAEIADIRKEMKNIDAFLSKVPSIQFPDEVKEKEAELAKLVENRKRLVDENGVLEHQATLMQAQIDKVSIAGCKTSSGFEYPKCPLLNVNDLLTHQHDLKSKLTKNKRTIAGLDKRISAAQDAVEIAKNNDEYNLYSKIILSMEEKNQASEALSHKNKLLGALESEIERLEAITCKEEILKKQLKQAEKTYRYSEFLGRAFSREGIPSIIIDNALPNINRIANDICVDFYVPFRFDISATKETKKGETVENLNIMLIDEAGKTRHVSSFSGGERQLAQLIIRFAIQEYLKQFLYRPAFDIFIGDEIWSEMDSNMMDICFRIISNKKDFEQIIIVSHDHSLVPNFENIIDVGKQDNSTRISIL